MDVSILKNDDAIVSRISKLNQMFLGKSVSKSFLVGREGLLDALFVIYDECNNEHMMRNQHVENFVNKFEPVISELKQLRISVQDFELQTIIGRGHFGEVQVVREKQTGDVYAMKTLHKYATLSQENIAFYEEERDIMAKANSPWITHLQYAFQDAEALHLVMEFHPGGDLLSLLGRYDDILEESMARFYLAEMVLAINSLHTMGYVHRDIKPENILIDRTGHIKLADFGSSAKLSSSRTVTSKMPVGTPDYVSPELLIAMNSSTGMGCYGVEVDWWSVGIVAYEMLYGVTPFADDGNSMVATYSNIMNYKKSIVFRPDQPISSEAKSLIKGLLTGANDRMGYEELKLHKFFSNTEFETIRISKPPFIPTITSMDDTSNFEEFDKAKPKPVPGDFKTRKEFSGKNLPFVGFTFTKNQMTGSERSHLSEILSPVKNANSYEQKLASKTKEVLTVREKCLRLENGENRMKNDIEHLKVQLCERDEQLSKVTAERDKLEKDMVTYITDSVGIKRLLDLERQDREETDNKAVEILESIREQNELAKQMREEDHKEQMEDLLDTIVAHEEEKTMMQKTITKLENQSKERTQDLKTAAEKVTELQERLNKMKAERRTSCVVLSTENNKECEDKITELEQQVEQLLVKKTDLTNLFRETRQDKARLEKELRELKFVSGAEDVPGMKKKLTDLEEKCRKQDQELKTLRTAENREREVKEDLEVKNMKVSELRDKVFELEEQLRSSEQDMRKEERLAKYKIGQLEDKIEEIESEVKQLKSKNTKLNKDTDKQQEDRNKSQLIVSDLEVEITELKEDKKKLATELKDLKMTSKYFGKDEPCEVRQSRRKQTEIIGDLEQEKSYLETKVERLERLLKRKDSTGDDYKDKVKELQDDLKKKTEKCDIKVKEAKENQQKSDLSLAEANENVAILSDNVTLLKTKLEREERNSRDTIRKLENEKLETKRKLETMQDSCSIIQEMEDELHGLAGKYDELILQNRQLETQLQEALAENADTSATDSLKEALAEKNKKCEHLEEKLKSYKAIVDEMELQLEELEALVASYEEKESEWHSAKREYQKEADKFEAEFEATKRKLQLETKAREAANKKIAELTKAGELAKQSQNGELGSLTVKLQEQKTKTSRLHEQLNQTEKEHSMAELNIKNMQRKLGSEEDESVKLKEEISKKITECNNLKEINLKLTHGLEEAIEKCEQLKADKLDLENAVENMEMAFEQETFKLESTLSQQTKLIDYLQAKGDAPPPKKKKTLFGTPAKGNEGTATLKPSTSVKDLHHSLEVERARTKRLHDQLTDLRAELYSAKTESIKCTCKVLRQSLSSSSNEYVPTSAPSSPKSKTTVSRNSRLPLLTPAKSMVLKKLEPEQTPVTYKRPEEKLDTASFGTPNYKAVPTGTYTPSIPRIKKTRIHHEISHKFVTGLNTRATKCAVCLGAVPFVKTASKCQECHVVCHPGCKDQLRNTCGIPTEYMTVFSEMMNKKPASPTKRLSPDSLGMEMSGWLKVPRSGKQAWERKFVKIVGSTLSIYDQEDNRGHARDKFDLCPKNGDVTVHSAITAAELGNTVPSDLPYIFRLESRPYTSCWPGRSLYLMALSFSEKQKWVATLETITSCSATRDFEREAKLLGNSIICLEGPEKIDVNCSLLLNNEVLLVGAEEGLFAVELLKKNGSPIPIQIDGLTGVYQINKIPESDLILMITGKERRLVRTELRSIKTYLLGQKTNITVKHVEDIVGCTIFTCKHVGDHSCIVVATPHKVVILKKEYNLGSDTISYRKEFDTREACSCLHITSEYVIIGTDKFYRFNLHTYELLEFLDKKDASVAFAAFGAAQYNSYPIAVLQVSDTPREFLLCFHEFGLFVDSNGRRSRDEDLKWAGLPLWFAYREPYLYVTHFNAMLVMEILPPNSDKGRGAHTIVDIMTPRYLGPAVSDGAVYVASVMTDAVEIMCFKGNMQAEKENIATRPINPMLSSVGYYDDDEKPSSSWTPTSKASSVRYKGGKLVTSPTRDGSSKKRQKGKGFVSPEHSPVKYGRRIKYDPSENVLASRVVKRVYYSDTSDTETDY